MAVANKRLRVLVAGAGGFGTEHIARLASRPDVEIAGIADPNVAARERAQQRFGIADCRAEALELIGAVEAEAIVIATPAASHVQLAEAALQRGICVLLEKPVAQSAEELERLMAAAQRSDAFVLPGHVLRFSKDHAKLVDTVRLGKIGTPLYVNSRRYRDEGHARIYPDSDPILMTLVHDIDLAQWITGSHFRNAQARRTGGPGTRSLTAVSATTASGVICDLRTAWTFPGAAQPPDLVEVVGDRGSIELTIGQGLSVWDSEGRADLPLTPGDDPLSNEHAHFLACSRDRAKPRALGLTEAMIGLRLADATRASIAAGREVEVAG